MAAEALPTQFAPAERSNSKEIQRQVELFASSPLVELIDYIPEIVLILNRNRQVIYANQAVESLFRKNKLNAVYGLRTGEVLDCVHSHETEGGCGTTLFCGQCGAIRAILSSLRGEEDVQECRLTQDNSGDAIDLRVWTYPITIDKELFTVFTAVDIGNEKRREALERIFVHDILNTIGNLHSFAEFLKEADTKDAEEFRELIFNLSSRALDEIRSHRELMAAERNELSVNLEPIDSLELLEEIRSYFSKSEIANDCHIQISSDAEKVSITSDKTLLSRVLSNMVKNALEASVPGNVINLSVEPTGEEVQFSVHNPGYIPGDVQLQIFQRSFTTKGAGRGLGTYSMRLLSERYLGGRVTFVSVEGEGTTFYGIYPQVLVK
ncbi:MAG: PAS domain-containing sensor histidine kinase [Dehalococcoidales bacterium]|nr:PAS domain-containing sensor histidine kinase [Dehalococcoidales bacterium]